MYIVASNYRGNLQDDSNEPAAPLVCPLVSRIRCHVTAPDPGCFVTRSCPNLHFCQCSGFMIFTEPSLAEHPYWTENGVLDRSGTQGTQVFSDQTQASLGMSGIFRGLGTETEIKLGGVPSLRKQDGKSRETQTQTP